VNANDKCVSSASNSANWGNLWNPLIAYSCNNEQGQIWSYTNIRQIGGTTYGHLCNQWGPCIASPANSADNTVVIQWGYVDEAGQRFTIIPSSLISGYYLIKNQFGKCLAQGTVLTNIIYAWDCGSQNQPGMLWKFV
jgi:hypothetical protein